MIPLLFALNADVPPQPEMRYRHAVSVQPLAFLGDGVALQYENFALPPRLSVAAGLGARWGASGDFTGRTYAIGTELRWWLTGSFFQSGQPARSMVGPYLFGRIDGSTTTVHMGERSLGSSIDLAETLGAGLRALVFSRVEVTPYLGFGAITSFDTGGRLSPYTRGVVKMGFTVGVMF